MRIKAMVALGIFAVLLSASLLAMALPARQDRYGNLLLIIPESLRAPGFSSEAVEQFCEDKFLLTYGIPQVKKAEAVRTACQIIAIGTNSSYADLMRYTLLNGSFFTKSAWESKEKHAVLNETAAYSIFGSIKISGKTLKIEGNTWLVTGVLQDGDTENANVYVPSSVIGGRVDSLMALIDDNAGITEAYAQNELKALGVNDESYSIVNLSVAADSYWERLFLALKTAACFAVVVVMRWELISLRTRFLRCKERLRQQYLWEILAGFRMGVVETAGSFLFLLVGAAGILTILLQILATCLKWRELYPGRVFGNMGFNAVTEFLRDYDLPGKIVFAVLMLVLAVLFILALKYPARNKKGSKNMVITDG